MGLGRAWRPEPNFGSQAVAKCCLSLSCGQKSEPDCLPTAKPTLWFDCYKFLFHRACLATFATQSARSGHSRRADRCPLSGGKADMRCGVAAQRRSAGNEVHIEVSHCFQASSLGTHLKAKSHRWVCERMRSPGHVATLLFAMRA